MLFKDKEVLEKLQEIEKKINSLANMIKNEKIKNASKKKCITIGGEKDV